MHVSCSPPSKQCDGRPCRLTEGLTPLRGSDPHPQHVNCYRWRWDGKWDLRWRMEDDSLANEILSTAYKEEGRDDEDVERVREKLTPSRGEGPESDDSSPTPTNIPASTGGPVRWG